MYRVYSIVFLCILSLSAYAQTQIPQGIRKNPDGRPVPEQDLVAPIDWNSIVANSVTSVFSCTGSSYYVGFQLAYDLGNNNTEAAWTANLEIAFILNTDTLWKKPLTVRTIDQTFVATVFHNSAIPCSGNYKYHIKSKTVSGTVPAANVSLTVLRFKEFENTFSTSSTISLNASVSPMPTTLSWIPQAGSGGRIAYDIEWVFVESNEGYSIPNQPAAFTAKQPVRVTVGAGVNSYNHITYYPTGSVYYRIRAVGYNPAFPMHRINGNWNYPAAAVPITNHNAQYTWQLQTVFAEEGKYKKIMSYYDGTLRQRQVLTNLSSENVALVGEIAYDFEGRKAVDILPVPGTDATLTYKPGFNVFQQQDPAVASNTNSTKKKFHYDNRNAQNSIISNASGAGKYYSAQTATNTIKDYIPDSEGYVFSQTEYLNDGTGRVSKQSGVGKEFKMDGDHTTKTYYGSAAPSELVRLFGANVGNASHYKKNLVVDPNGQVSVSYLDQEDRVIATALAGDKPENVDALQSYENLLEDDITVNLNDRNQKANGLSVTSHKVMNVAVNTAYTFTYNLSALASDLGDGQCENCVYDLKITITDPDGLPLDLSGEAGNQSVTPTIAYERKNLTGDDCVAPSLTTVVLSDIMFEDIGDYTITKTLTPHELTFETVTQIVTQTQTIQELMEEIRLSYEVDSTNCEICTTCDADAVIDEAIDGIAEMDCENIMSQIVQAIKDSPAHEADPFYEPTPAEISSHPMICEYNLCVQNKPSDVFERQLFRIKKWSDAVTAGYTNLWNVDPFFNNSTQSGFSHKTTMVNKMNSISIQTVEDGPMFGSASILTVTDPTSPAYRVDENGEYFPHGYHVLYYDLRSRGYSNSSPEVDEQRWTLYKSFYDEAKRQIKITAFSSCPSAVAKLQQQDEFPLTADEVEEYGEQEGIIIDADSIEISTAYNSLVSKCNVALNTTDSTAIRGHLESYFNNNPDNFFRLILTEDLNADPDLASIQTILNTRCSLDSLAFENPLTKCLQDSVIMYNKYDQDPEPCPLCRSQRKEFYSKLQREAMHKDGDFTVMKDKIPFTGQKVLYPLPLPEEYNALIDLYNSTNGPGWLNKTNWNTANPNVVEYVGDWFGVTVDAEGHVIRIELDSIVADGNYKGNVNNIPGNNLVGTIPASIGDLKYLRSINLAGNSLTGTLPGEIGKLINLEWFVLTDNQLSGQIPASIGQLKKVDRIFFGFNQFSGSIPPSIGDIPNLWALNLNDNNLTGSFPQELTRLKYLQYLHLFNNKLSGVLPSNLGDMTALLHFEVNGNNISGPVPASLSGLPLTWLFLSDNSFSGKVPNQLASIPNLDYFMIEGNKFTFSDFLEVKALQTADNFVYNDQALVDVKKGINADPGETVVLTSAIDRATSPSSKYQWFKNGVSLGPASTTNHTLTLTNVSSSNNGFYTYQITNTNASQLTLISRPQWLLVDSTMGSFVLCTEYDTTNATIQGMTFRADWSRVVEQCLANAAKEDSILVSHAYSILLDEQATEFYSKQSTNCLGNAEENFMYSYGPKEYHYTLYYYDQAGNLVQTIPPNGVRTFGTDTVNNILAGSLSLEPEHKLPTRYRYNSINQIEWQSSPDGGQSELWYDNKGQLRLSQNAEQQKHRKYAYTRYDEQGRITEVGELTTLQNISLLESKLEEPGFPDNSYVVKDVTKTFYDLPNGVIQAQFPQSYLRSRVSWTESHEDVKNIAPELLINGGFTSNLGSWTQTGASTVSWTWDSSNGGRAAVTVNGSPSKALSQGIGPVIAGENITLKIDHTASGAGGTKADELLIRFCTAPGVPVQEFYLIKDETVFTAQTNFSYIEIIANDNAATYSINSISVRRSYNINSTYYTYDIHGNVKALLQRKAGIADKRTDYLYDLVSGKVNFVFYQYNQPDQFVHRYFYDADNRIKEVHTSADGFLYDKDAVYSYYQHGPLSRIVLGNYTGAQGLDYYYTLQGWTKGVNMPYTVAANVDPGNDGYNPSKVGRDVFAYALGYYQYDYKPRVAAKIISDTRDLLWTQYHSYYDESTGYYNGNIAWMQTDLKKIGQQKASRVKGVQAMMYRYDQLHRITKSRSLTVYSQATRFTAHGVSPEAYDEDFSYDANGNLLTLDRWNNAAVQTDDFNYRYYKNSNRLRYVNNITRDTIYSGNIVGTGKVYNNITVLASANVANGQSAHIKAINNIDFEPTFDYNDNATSLRATVLDEDEGEFNYDAIGNLIWDQNTGVQITWTPYGKVRTVAKPNGDSIIFKYDPGGNRIEKRTRTATVINTTHYVRDAGGNIMSVYHSGAAQNIEWTAPVGVTISGGTVTKPGGAGSWNAGASSMQILPAGTDGYIEFKVTSLSGNRMIGFNDADRDANYTNIEYAVYLNGNSLKAYSTTSTTPVYDGGVNSLALNDVIKLERLGSTVYLRKNGVLLHSFALASTTRLVADISINTVSAFIEGVKYRFGEVMLTEQPIYGSSRLGQYRGNRELGVRRLGHNNFELTNHLGNVLAVITDNIRLFSDSAWATVVNSSDYYAFGSEMPTRTYSKDSDYRYGFNGKEQDQEKTWGDDVYDYGFRIYNPKIGRFLSTDPLTSEFPDLSPYQFAGNCPISMIDLDGLEPANPLDKFIDVTRDFKPQTTKSFMAAGLLNNVTPVDGNYKRYVTRLGRIFEDAVIRSSLAVHNTQLYYYKTAIKNPDAKGVIPDMVKNSKFILYDPQGKGKRMVFKDAAFFEAKFKSEIASEPSENPQQLKTMIDVLSEMKGGWVDGKWNASIRASDYGMAALTLITPSNTTVDADLISYATQKNVQLIQRTTEEDSDNPSRMRVSTGITLNTIKTVREIPQEAFGNGHSVEVNWEKK